MIRRLPALLVIVVFAALVEASAATESTIVPGVGIGQVKLGMTATQVERVLGHGNIVNGRATIGGTKYVELSWDFGRWAVAFRKTGRTLRTVQVSTLERAQKTATAIGPGTRWLKLVRAYPGGLCALGNSLGLPSAGRSMGAYLQYLVPHRGGTQTLFLLRGVAEDKSDPMRRTDNIVWEVHVRTPFYRLPEFAPDSRQRCRPGWETTRTPEFGG